MGFAAFRAAFVEDGSNNWHVTPSDGVLKQNDDTHFAVTFRPRHPGVSSGYLVIETQVSVNDTIFCLFDKAVDLDALLNTL